VHRDHKGSNPLQINQSINQCTPASTEIDSPDAEVVGGATCLKAVKEVEWGCKIVFRGTSQRS
jgi:hypothetical protein